MNRLLTVCALAALGLLCMGQKPAGPSLTYKVAIGGLNAGTFASMEVPTHKAIIQGDNVAITEISKTVDKSTEVKFSGGTVSSFLRKKIEDKVGQQMTVEIQVVPVGLGAGQRCKFHLEHAFLKKVAPDGLSFRPSELPEYKCSGGK